MSNCTNPHGLDGTDQTIDHDTHNERDVDQLPGSLNEAVYVTKCTEVESKNETKKSNEKHKYSHQNVTSHRRDSNNSPIVDRAFPGSNQMSIQNRSQENFPMKLFKLLEICDTSGYSSAISWLPHGLAFQIHDEVLFADQIMKKYFGQAKSETFKQQLYVMA